ncbi:MAG TPA: hypothetical protein H9790_04580 [Candidatus Agathobaculum intestinipullorum]|nr:hypothetical protein [uncultured Agathobaculum sp.]HJA48590.1 hypothetical protein [Candidatus Agathobaculum intestinipullorum]
MTEAIRQTTQDILRVCQPQRIILFAEKRTMSTGKLKAFSLCIIVPDGSDCRHLRTQLHLALSADVPVNLNVYTADEWDDLLEDETSYAAWIARKGQVIYEPET